MSCCQRCDYETQQELTHKLIHIQKEMKELQPSVARYWRLMEDQYEIESKIKDLTSPKRIA